MRKEQIKKLLQNLEKLSEKQLLIMLVSIMIRHDDKIGNDLLLWEQFNQFNKQ